MNQPTMVPGSLGAAAPRALVVDDNALNLELAHCLLAAAGFEVELVDQPLLAIERALGFDPAVVLMDIQMPGADGLSLTRQLKADPRTAHIPVVAFTALAMRGDELRIRAAGCDGYIAKPIDVAGFAASVRRYLRPPTSASGD